MKILLILFYPFHTLILLFAERAIFWLGLYGGEKLHNHLEWGDYVTSLHHSGPIFSYRSTGFKSTLELPDVPARMLTSIVSRSI